ncbi:MAG: phosphate butyryltransferase [Thermotogae bacterium]|nr:phosphate butyryltransferase [Thermotogota bacterium]
MYRSFAQIREEAKKVTGMVLAIPWGVDDYSLRTAIKSVQMGLVDSVILYISETLPSLPYGIRIKKVTDPHEASRRAVEDVLKGEAHIIMKGFLKTGTLLKEVLRKERGLRTDRILSDVLIAEDPATDKSRLVGMTDGGVNVAPDLKTKLEIVKNAVEVFHTLGFDKPRVALLSAVEYPTEKIPSSVEAAEIKRIYEEGGSSDCVVDGPLALDVAVSKMAARRKNLESEVAGEADILVVPNIEAGNILGKAYTYYAKVPVGHVIFGAKVPILIPSRNESDEDKLNSVALGILVSRGLSHP